MPTTVLWPGARPAVPARVVRPPGRVLRRRRPAPAARRRATSARSRPPSGGRGDSRAPQPGAARPPARASASHRVSPAGPPSTSSGIASVSCASRGDRRAARERRRPPRCRPPRRPRRARACRRASPTASAAARRAARRPARRRRSPCPSASTSDRHAGQRVHQRADAVGVADVRLGARGARSPPARRRVAGRAAHGVAGRDELARPAPGRGSRSRRSGLAPPLGAPACLALVELAPVAHRVGRRPPPRCARAAPRRRRIAFCGLEHLRDVVDARSRSRPRASASASSRARRRPSAASRAAEQQERDDEAPASPPVMIAVNGSTRRECTVPPA